MDDPPEDLVAERGRPVHDPGPRTQHVQVRPADARPLDLDERLVGGRLGQVARTDADGQVALDEQGAGRRHRAAAIATGASAPGDQPRLADSRALTSRPRSAASSTSGGWRWAVT